MQPIWHGLTWPSSDYSRVPYGVFSDPRIYAEEQELIFRGPVWTNIALEAEIPDPGDYRSSYVGDTPVVAVRGKDGAVHAFVNRCAHRGTLLVRDGGGNVEDFTCVYHHWCYDLEGNLVGVPFRRGLKGKGGMPGDFRMSEHGLRRLRVECYRGAVFATFDDGAEDIRAYLGADGVAFLDRLFHKPIRILGYMRQRIPANWKLYLENLKDANHAGLLHQMPVTFGLWRNTQAGGSKLDSRKRHEIHYGYVDTDTEEDAQDGYDGVRSYNAELTLNDSCIVDYVPEWGDDISSQFLSMFPASVFQQFANTIATRQIRPRKTDEFELFWTVFGYADDDEEALRRRLMQNNLAGPAGVVSMEDGEAPHLVQRAVGHDPEGHSLIAYGGTGPIEDQTTVITEVAVRGFWKYYCELMRVPAAMAAQAAE